MNNGVVSAADCAQHCPVRSAHDRAEMGWLLEYTIGGRTYYFTCTSGTPTWTHDANQAVRFSRKQDAEMLGAELFGTLRTVANEHTWS